MNKSALITGITGQDGSYLSELLLSTGYTVHGIVRRSSSFNTARIDHLYEDPHETGRRLVLHYADLSDSTGLRRVVEAARPDEIYNLGAQSHVKVSFENPEYTADADAVGTLRLLDCMRDHVQHTGRDVRFYQAGSSEMFGAAKPPQCESYRRSIRAARMPFRKWPRTGTPSTTAKLTACSSRNGILFNHESPAPRRDVCHAQDHARRGAASSRAAAEAFPRAISTPGAIGAIAGDYVEAMWLMLQHAEPDDLRGRHRRSLLSA